jgi:hypothetical protein
VEDMEDDGKTVTATSFWINKAVTKVLTTVQAMDDILTCSKDLAIEAYPIALSEIRYHLSPKKKLLSPGDLCRYSSQTYSFVYDYKGMVFDSRLGKYRPVYRQIKLDNESLVMFCNYLEDTINDTLHDKCEIFYKETTYVVGYPKSYIAARRMIPDDVLQKLM